MFYWICPECGGEIPPAAKACPVCEPSNEVVGAPVSASPASATPVAKESITASAPSVKETAGTQSEIKPVAQVHPEVPPAAEIVSGVNETIETKESVQPAAIEKSDESTTAAVSLVETPPAAAVIEKASEPVAESSAETLETPAPEIETAVAPDLAPAAERAMEQTTEPPERETPAREVEAPVAAEVAAPVETVATPVSEPVALEQVTSEQTTETPQPDASAPQEMDTPVAVEPAALAQETVSEDPVSAEAANPESVSTEPKSPEAVSPIPVSGEPQSAIPVSDVPEDPLFALAEQIRSVQVRHDAAQAAIFEPASQPVPVVPEVPAGNIVADFKETAPIAEAAPIIAEAAPVAEAQGAESSKLEREAEPPQQPARVEAPAIPELPRVTPPVPLSGLARLVSAVGVVELISSAGVVERVSSPGVADAHKPALPGQASGEVNPPESAPSEIASREIRSLEAAFHEDSAPADAWAGIIETNLKTAAEQLAMSLSLGSREVTSQVASRETNLPESTSQTVHAAVALLEPPAAGPAGPSVPPHPIPETIAPPAAALVEAPPPAPEASGVVPSGISPLADAPPSGSRLALAPLQSYKSAASRAMHPAVPSSKILAQESIPKITLPGPALPPELVSLQSGGVITKLGNDALPRKRGGTPGWLVSFLVMLALLLLGTVLFNSSSDQHSKIDAKSVPVETAAPVVQNASHPLAHYIEVTGFRIVVDFNKKSEIHYLVVNHSSAALSDLTVYVTLRSVGAKPGQPPVSRFSFRSPDLAPFESKEMTSPIEKVTRSVAVPDWAELRAEVQVTQ